MVLISFIYSSTDVTIIAYFSFTTLDKAFKFYMEVNQENTPLPTFHYHNLDSYKKLIKYVKKEFLVSCFDSDSDYYEYIISEFNDLFNH